MNNLCNAFLFIYVLVLFSVNCFAEEITIQILTERPDFINEKYWKTYSSSIENYLKSNLGQETSNDISISFSYNSDEPSDKTKEKDYENYVKYVVEQLKSSTYDMVILDDNFYLVIILLSKVPMLKLFLMSERLINFIMI